ncbi:hypothetical protein AG1IA_09172 [Rhizoctonia solani AG-1 IA]|uniref:Uncharacterized protein n=1 Tax=Thanatephorus cucumeris (strain AG1-IA) TaxID=983506 RepID=L8WJ22_THACA|nr:hypothetical protein AG1IA_09172 [Rhizoctonia solani AG-1 IA]
MRLRDINVDRGDLHKTHNVGSSTFRNYMHTCDEAELLCYAPIAYHHRETTRSQARTSKLGFGTFHPTQRQNPLYMVHCAHTQGCDVTRGTGDPFGHEPLPLIRGAQNGIDSECSLVLLITVLLHLHYWSTWDTIPTELRKFSSKATAIQSPLLSSKWPGLRETPGMAHCLSRHFPTG